MIQFKKKVDVESKEEQADMEDDPDKEEMEKINLDEKRERHWSMLFEDNGGGDNNRKALIHAKM